MGIEEACTAMQRGWIDEKGAINRVFLQETYSAVTLKAQTFIDQCLVLEGNGVNEVEEIFDDYDYSDYYDDYDDYDYYDYEDNEVDEKSGGRKTRSVDDGKLRSRVKQRQEQRAGRRGQGGNRTKRRKKKKNNTKKEERRALKKIGLKKAPSQLVLAQVKCIWLAVDLALEDCGKNILQASRISHD